MLAIVGPTGSGKARLARAVAAERGALLVSCDSMKVYRRMDVGTAKPAPAERAAWRGLDLVEPWESFDASRFCEVFEAARAEGRPLLLSGGTMLYLKAATEGLAEAPPRDAALRERLRTQAEREDLHPRLAEVDPETAAWVHPNDLRRIVRALEVHELTGRPLSSFHGQFGAVREDLERAVVVVTRAREDMDRRIDDRVARMFLEGWVAECEALAADPRGVSTEAGQAIGYRQIFEWLAAGRPEPEAQLIERIQRATRRFARRQLTWIRNLEEEGARVRRLEVAEGQDTLDHLLEVSRWLE